MTPLQYTFIIEVIIGKIDEKSIKIDWKTMTHRRKTMKQPMNIAAKPLKFKEKRQFRQIYTFVYEPGPTVVLEMYRPENLRKV